jgi:signal recognition particle subunit SRP54
MAGLQGAGKTTTAGKLAHFLIQKNKKVLLVSTDIYRPAAIEQLQTLAMQLNVDCFASTAMQNPRDIASNALNHAKKHFYDVLIVDTAGRLGIDQVMMDEIKSLHHTLKPVETLFIVDAMQGQDAVNTAKAFHETLPLTGIILTKLDGDARGGAALSVRHVTGKPIKFIGVGEKLAALEPFYPERLASRILGMGDVLSLIEQVQQKVDQQAVDNMAKKIKSGKGFDLEDFRQQLIQMKKMGGMNALMDKMPGQFNSPMPTQMTDKKMLRTEAIINSMTVVERSKPDILKASRKRRIAAGAGVSVQEVNQLLNQFEQMQKVMKQFKGGVGMAKLKRGLTGQFLK